MHPYPLRTRPRSAFTGVAARRYLGGVLVPCPECAREVSDRAAACPRCGFPIAQHVAEARAREDAEHERTTRRDVGETDCVRCEARGFVVRRMPDEDGNEASAFAWCEVCEHSGRVRLVESTGGFFAVGFAIVDAFVRGEASHDAVGVTALGPTRPASHRYAQAGGRVPKSDD